MEASGAFGLFFSGKTQEYYRKRSLTDRLILKGDRFSIKKQPYFFEKIWDQNRLTEENRKAWTFFQNQIFSRSFVEQQKIYAIFAKHKIDLEEKIQAGCFLEKKHMDLVLVSLATPTLLDLGKKPGKLSALEISKKIDSLVTPYFKAFSFPPLSEGFWGVYELLFIDPVSREKERFACVQQLASLKTHDSYWELLCKEVASRELEVGMILPSLGGEDFYYVYKKISQEGLVAYAVKPLREGSKLNPALFFRPSQMSLTAENAIETFVDDLHLEGVGYGGFQSACNQLEDLINDKNFRRPGEKIVVGGFSLGGAYAQYFLAHQENWKIVQEALFFNDPGVDKKTAEVFAQKINQADNLHEVPVLSLFRTEGDYMDHGGDSHVGFGVKNPNSQMTLTQTIPIDSKTSALNRHILCFSKENARKQKINLNDKENQWLLDTSERGEEALSWEGFRRSLGHLLRPILVLFIWLYAFWKRWNEVDRAKFSIKMLR